MHTYLEALVSNQTWGIEEIPRGKRAIACKWDLKTKRDDQGNIKRYKGRLVIKGCAQQQGEQFNEVFSLVA